jgi:hypothetical protein
MVYSHMWLNPSKDDYHFFLARFHFLWMIATLATNQNSYQKHFVSMWEQYNTLGHIKCSKSLRVQFMWRHKLLWVNSWYNTFGYLLNGHITSKFNTSWFLDLTSMCSQSGMIFRSCCCVVSVLIRATLKGPKRSKISRSNFKPIQYLGWTLLHS